MQSVQVQGTVYVGGGGADSTDNEYIVMAYNISADKWATLPPYGTRYFAMTATHNHLVLVGGQGHGDSSKVLGAWSEDSKKWTYPYPNMSIPRDSCTAAVYKHYLVVAGGRASGVRLSSTDIMNVDTKQWYAGPPTPIAWSEMKTTIAGDTCYFIGGFIEGTGRTTKVYSASLPALVSQLNSDCSAEDTQIWKELPQLPVTCAAPLYIRGSLLAVGGFKDGSSTALHLYQPDAGQWVKVADMPTPRQTPTCIMIAHNKILVAGDYTGSNLATVDIACIL